MSRNSKRIQRILHIRKRQEEAARATWLQAELEARKATERVDQQTQQLEKGQAQVRELQESDPSAVLSADWVLERMLENQFRLQSAALVRAKQSEAAKGPWLECRKTLLAMEKWKDRSERDWREWSAMREEKAQESSLEAHISHKKQNEVTL